MILSDCTLKKCIITNETEKEQAKKWWINADWDNIEKIGEKIIIDPFNPNNLGLCCYDLSVGDEYVSLRDPYNIKQLSDTETIIVNPSETLLILSKEYLCLPRTVMGTIVPRARWIFEGTGINATRIDPTWYGKLLVGFTNYGKDAIILSKGEKFCTCYFIRCERVENYLKESDISFLGRTKIVKVDFSHVRPHKLIPINKVSRDDVERVVDNYGTPFDIIYGAIELSFTEIKEFIGNEMATDIARKATDEAVKKAFSSQTKINYILVTGLLSALFTIIIKLLFFPSP